jgi:hypothetical protein
MSAAPQPTLQQAPPPPNYPMPTPPPTPPKSNALAVTALVLGIITCVIPFVGLLTGPAAIVLAVMAKKEIPLKGEGGSGFATAGLVTGIVGCAGYALWIMLLFFGLFMGAA